ncbi:MAG: DNA polymerase IV [Firmicutes bacterium]|nr:DNA polymerase IV [Bacillota bacterium]
MDRIIMHIDVNNAFLSWSAVYYLLKGSKIDIRNTYAVIGGDETKRTGIVLAKSNPAKKCGVVTGETLYSARKKCKGLKNYPMNYNFYKKMSNAFFNIIKKYTPDIEIASIDECYIDYTKVKGMYGVPLEFAKKLQKEINDKLKFTINIGIANNKLCAKMASDFEKPNKIHTLYKNEIKEKMWPLDVSELFTVGKKSSEKLKLLNINTIKDLALADPMRLYPFFKNQTTYYINIANGIDNSEVITEYREYKGISNEITLPYDIDNYNELEKYVLLLSEKVSLRLRKQNKYTQTIAIILKNNFFKRRTHQRKIKNATDSTDEIYKISMEILKEMWNDESIRLIGIRLDDLTEEKITQISLFKNIENTDKLDKTLDNLKNKYGSNIISKATNVYDKKM